MSVLINGMEMPREGGVIVIYKISGKFFAQRGRADKLCPLVPVPPHSRLIDADKLLNTAFQLVDEETFRAFRQLVIDAPTIIEAEEG